MATVLNFFITYGDTFLASPSDYDDLYYELIRLRTTVEAFCAKGFPLSLSHSVYRCIPRLLALPLPPSRSVSLSGSFAASISFFLTPIASEEDSGLAQSLENVKLIITHFAAKLDSWTLSHADTPLTPPQVFRMKACRDRAIGIPAGVVDLAQVHRVTMTGGWHHQGKLREPQAALV
jgi:hypothetical protein